MAMLGFFCCFFILAPILVHGIEKFSSTDCGISRGCWAFRPDCGDSDTCDGLIRWALQDDKLLLEFQAKDVSLFETGRYLAVGFSNDSYMGNDTVVECVFDENGIGGAYISHNEATANFQLLNASQELIVRSIAAMKDGLMMCEVELDMAGRSRAEEREKNLVHDLRDNEWRLLFARGLAMPETGEKMMHSLNAGDLFPWSTLETVKLCSDCPEKFKVISKMSQ